MSTKTVEPDVCDGITLTTIVKCDANGPTITCPDGATRGAIALCNGDALHKGQTVAVMFRDNNPTKPVVVGPIKNASAKIYAEPDTTIIQDHEKLEIRHDRRIVLRCGESVLSLSADGRIELNGEYLISTARGMNRIAGASVKIN